VPTAAASRTVAASPTAVWEVVGDPAQLARWWPRVQRVEAVRDGAFTEVLVGRRGKLVRADFSLVESTSMQRVVWSQQVAGTPFAAVLQSATTTIELAPAPAGAGVATQVRIELAQELPARAPGSGRGLLSSWVSGVPSFGSPLVSRAASRTLEQALDGLARVLADDG
jgi:uncharacterized protein YndB with AHSA1/START domain